jgi:hypothetical protein
LAFVTNTQSRIVIDSAGTVTVANNFVVSGNTTVSGTTIPASKTLVTTIDSQTLTNKTISGANNTLSNIPNNSLSNNSIIFGATTQALGSTISGLNGVSLGQGTSGAAAGTFTNLAYTGTLTGGTGVIAIGTNQIYKDASGNVGIGTNAPIRQFSVGTPNGGVNAIINLGSGTSSLGTIEFADGITGDDRFRGYIQYAHADNSLRLGTDAAERLRIDSFGRVGIGLTNLSDATTNGLGVLGTLGVGVSGIPGYKAAVYSGTSLGLNYNLLLTPEFGGLGRDSAIIFGATFNNNWGGVDYSPRYAGAIQFGASNSVFGEPRAWAMRFLVGAGDTPVERMRLDYNGNLGLGATPSAWGNVTNRVLEFSNGVALLGNLSVPAAYLVTNAYSANGGTVWTYKTSAPATMYLQNAGVHAWYNAPTGTAGNTATFTSAMTLTAAGNLLVGVTGRPERLAVVGDSGPQAVCFLAGNTAGDVGNSALVISKFDNNQSTSQVFVRFFSNNVGTANGQINGNGASQAAFGTYSDSRLKENIQTLPPQLHNICSLRPVEFDYIATEGGGHQYSFIAQEFEKIYPESVGERDDGMKTITGWGRTEAILVKAIQELHAEIESLKQRI